MDFNNILLFLINVIHILVILFVVITPFTNSLFLLSLHSFIVPFIMLHWLLNNDTCAITIAEKFVRTKMNGGQVVNDNDCLSYKVIGPVYNFMNDNVDYSKWTWTMTFTLWLITIIKLYYKYENGELSNINYQLIQNHQ
jgi:hypothetical protein